MRLMREGEEACAVGSKLHSVRHARVCVFKIKKTHKQLNRSNMNIPLFTELSKQALK